MFVGSTHHPDVGSFQNEGGFLRDSEKPTNVISHPCDEKFPHPASLERASQ